MAESFAAAAPIDIPEADLLEQRTPWQELPEDAETSVPGPSLAVTDRTADEGDLLEQALAAVPGPDDDDHLYGPSD
jgi:hypothetical protein